MDENQSNIDNGSTQESTVESTGEDVSQSGEVSTEGTQEQQQNDGDANAAENASAEADLVEGNDGKKYLPYEKFQQMNERMKKDRDDAAAFLETLKNDPAARNEFLGQPEKSNATGAKEGSESGLKPPAFQKFLQESGMEPAVQQHYQAVFGAFAEEMSEFVKEQMAPIMAHIGANQLEKLEAKIPDFGAYKDKVAKIMQEKGPQISAEDAYKLASYDDRFKKGVSTGVNQSKAHGDKMSKNPIQKHGGGNAPVSKPQKIDSFEDAFKKNWDKFQDK